MPSLNPLRSVFCHIFDYTLSSVRWLAVTESGKKCPRADTLHQPGGCSVRCLDDSQCSSDEQCCLTSCGGYSCIPAHQQQSGIISSLCYPFLCPRPVGKGHYKMGRGVRPSIRLSVCPVPRLNSRIEKPRKPKIGRMITMITHHTTISWTYLEVKRSKVKVTGPINAHTINRNIFWKGRPTNFKLLCRWSTKTHISHRQASWPTTSKVKVTRSHDASNRYWPISREQKGTETPKL